MLMKNKSIKVGALLLAIGLASAQTACNKNSGEVIAALTGKAVLGNVSGSTCSAYEINADGSRGVLIGSAQTNAEGLYSIPSSGAGPAVVICVGGSYVDEATGTTVTLRSTDEIQAMIPDRSQQGFVSVNALSTIASGVVAKNAPQGLATAIANANLGMAAIFGFSGIDIVGVNSADFTRPMPPGVSSTSPEAKMGLAMAAFTQVAKDNALTPVQVLDLIKNMREDYKDGTMDGSNAGVALPVALTLSPANAIAGFGTARTNFLNSPRNASGFGAGSF